MSRWPLLLLLSVAFGLGLRALHLPAATLIGPMAAAILLALKARAPALAPWAANGAQGVVGLLVAASLPPAMLAEIATRWPLVLAGTLSTVALASGLGWLLARSPLLPGTTAIWGSMPGAASVITFLSQHHGADLRLVAFMQYLRVVLVALSAALVARMAGLHDTPVPFFTPADPSGLAATLAAAFALAAIGQRLGLNGGAFLVPMIAGLALLHLTDLTFTLPPWALALANAVLGWSIGLRFTRQTLGAALGAFPRVAAAILTLIAACALAALALHRLAGIDLLTAWLATSPGGADTVAIIATQVRVDVPFVMTMQMSRFLLILLAGPHLARWLSARRA